MHNYWPVRGMAILVAPMCARYLRRWPKRAMTAMRQYVDASTMGTQSHKLAAGVAHISLAGAKVAVGMPSARAPSGALRPAMSFGYVGARSMHDI